jgi:hypothetical protein
MRISYDHKLEKERLQERTSPGKCFHDVRVFEQSPGKCLFLNQATRSQLSGADRGKTPYKFMYEENNHKLSRSSFHTEIINEKIISLFIPALNRLFDAGNCLLPHLPRHFYAY